MRIIIQDPPPGEEESIVLNVRHMTAKITRILDMLKTPDELTVDELTVYANEQALLLKINDIYYVESVDNKVFIYGQSEVYRIRLKLYEVEKLLASEDFLRVSKQVIVNVKMIRSIAPAGDGRFAANLVNNEAIIISRQFVPQLKRRFGL